MSADRDVVFVNMEVKIRTFNALMETRHHKCRNCGAVQEGGLG